MKDPRAWPQDRSGEIRDHRASIILPRQTLGERYHNGQGKFIAGIRAPVAGAKLFRPMTSVALEKGQQNVGIVMEWIQGRADGPESIPMNEPPVCAQGARGADRTMRCWFVLMKSGEPFVGRPGTSFWYQLDDQAVCTRHHGGPANHWRAGFRSAVMLRTKGRRNRLVRECPGSTFGGGPLVWPRGSRIS